MNRKNLWIATSAVILSLALFTGCGSPVSDTASNASGAGTTVAPVASPSSNVSAGIAGNASGDYITEQEAKDLALKNAGFAEDEVQFIRARLDYDDNRAEYDIEFVVGNEEYDYDIDAVTGEILSMDRDIEHYNSSSQVASQAPVTSGKETAPEKSGNQSFTASSTPAKTSSSSATDSYIGEDAAQKIALDHAGVSKDSVKFVYTQLERDDGRWKYEVEFYKDNTEYDYDIDAISGDILSYDHDAEYHSAPSNSGSSGEVSLTADEAKQIALKHAGVTEGDVQRMKVEFDHDHGRIKYEVEWDIGRTEYSYEIDASTGEILDYEKDMD